MSIATYGGELAMLEELITIQEAINRYGYSGTYYRRLIKTGRIRGRQLGKTWVIDPKSVEAFLKTDRKRGRPPLTNTK